MLKIFRCNHLSRYRTCFKTESIFCWPEYVSIRAPYKELPSCRWTGTGNCWVWLTGGLSEAGAHQPQQDGGLSASLSFLSGFSLIPEPTDHLQNKNCLEQTWFHRWVFKIKVLLLFRSSETGFKVLKRAAEMNLLIIYSSWWSIS